MDVCRLALQSFPCQGSWATIDPGLTLLFKANLVQPQDGAFAEYVLTPVGSVQRIALLT